MTSPLEKQLAEALLDLKRWVVQHEQGQTFGEYPNKMKIYDALAEYDRMNQPRQDY